MNKYKKKNKLMSKVSILLWSIGLMLLKILKQNLKADSLN